MILLINIVIGLVLAFGTSQLKQLREIVQAEIYFSVFYLIEILESIFKHNIRIYGSNIIISIIFIVLLPLIVFLLFWFLKGFIKSKNKEEKKLEEK